MKRYVAAALLALLPGIAASAEMSYPVVDTGQTGCFDDTGRASCPSRGQRFFGQDAQVAGRRPAYRDNGDGTVTDLVTGLMWQKGFQRVTWGEAGAAAASSRVGGHSDWRVPTIKELYSLMNFDGATGSASPSSTSAPSDARPYIDTGAFSFEYPSAPRFIDAQYVTSTVYLGTVMGGQRAFFGVNFADGRIKGYPLSGGPGNRQWYGRWVRGNPAYGRNDFVANGDGTVTDRATGLVWTQADSGDARFRAALAGTAMRDGRLDWGEALAFCAGLDLAGRSWRLPNAKELHTIVDYGRAPDATGSAAISPVFAITAITDDAGRQDWPYFWTGTSHLDGRRPGDFGVYFAFGRAGGHMSMGGQGMGGSGMGGPGMGGPGMGGPGMGGPGMGGPGMGGPGMGGPGMGGPGMGGPGMGGPGMGGPGMGGPGMGPPGMGNQQVGGGTLLDVHGAGAQRSSPKSGDESRLPKGAGPQGDVLRIYNFARCVSDAS